MWPHPPRRASGAHLASSIWTHALQYFGIEQALLLDVWTTACHSRGGMFSTSRKVSARCVCSGTSNSTASWAVARRMSGVQCRERAARPMG